MIKLEVQGNTLVRCINNLSEGIEIPEGITEIGSYAFKDMTRITKIVLPSTLQTIGESAFERCIGLTEIVLPDNLTYIGRKAFCRCFGLEQIVIPDKVEVIEDSAFEFCTAIKEVIIGKSCNKIASTAFNNCGSLQAFSVHESNNAFISLSGILLTKDKSTLIRYPEAKPQAQIELSSAIHNIGDWAFYKCRKLRKLTFSDQLYEIGEYAFCEMINVKELFLNESIHKVALTAFTGWQKDQKIEFDSYFSSVLRYSIEQLLNDIKRNDKQNGQQFILVKTMFESEDEAYQMAKDLLDRHLIVSGQINNNLNSMYIWDNKVQFEKEVELTCFTRMDKSEMVESYIKSNHSYETCQFIIIPIIKASDEFGKWINDYINN